MRSRRLRLSTALTAVVVLPSACVLAACGQDRGIPKATATPTGASLSDSATPAAPAASPSKRPTAAPTSGSPDALGAHRVIPVPQPLAQAQQHRILPVDGQAVFLDNEAGTEPRPLVLVLAGLGEDAVAMRAGTGFTALAALTGFDVAYPEAPPDPPQTAASPADRTAQARTAQARTAQARTVAFVSGPAPAASPAAPSAETTGAPEATRTATSASPSPTPTPTSTSTPGTSRSPSSPAPTPTPKASPTPTRKPSPTPSPKPSRSPAKRPSPLSPGTRAWNAGICCAPPGRDDVRYLVDVVHAVEASVPVDASRVYVLGFSNGGMMALDAVCSAPSVFAAAGSVAGPFLGSHCARPIWRHLAAAPDSVVPTAGGIPAGLPDLGIVRDWCGCSFPSTNSETARFGVFASVVIWPTGGHFWPTPSSATWPYDPEHDLWNYVSRFHL